MRIESDITIPDIKRKSKNKEILEKLDVGDSIYLPNTLTRKVHARFAYQTKSLNIKIKCRKENTGVRLWRVS